MVQQTNLSTVGDEQEAEVDIKPSSICSAKYGKENTPFLKPPCTPHLIIVIPEREKFVTFVNPTPPSLYSQLMTT